MHQTYSSFPKTSTGLTIIHRDSSNNYLSFDSDTNNTSRTVEIKSSPDSNQSTPEEFEKPYSNNSIKSHQFNEKNQYQNSSHFQSAKADENNSLSIYQSNQKFRILQEQNKFNRILI